MVHLQIPKCRCIIALERTIVKVCQRFLCSGIRQECKLKISTFPLNRSTSSILRLQNPQNATFLHPQPISLTPSQLSTSLPKNQRLPKKSALRSRVQTAAEAFFQVWEAVCRQAGNPKRSPSSRNAIVFAAGPVLRRHRPTGTRGTRPASIEDRLRSARISARSPCAVRERRTHGLTAPQQRGE